MTIPKDCKRLAEVDFPIAEVSKHAAREKSIRHGHPSTLHLWWARRPLASSRAVLMALLLPDPLDPLCPADFKSQARTLLAQVQNVGKGDEGLRAGLLKFIGDFANWDLASNQQYLTTSRGLVKAAHPDETPLVVDPFAGGGSIPLEALRLGCDAFASDLNPVAGLIQKVMLEDIPRYGRQKIKVQTEGGEVEADGLAAALRLAGVEIKKAAEKELAEFYPTDPDGARPIAYLWARTVRCESPNCGADIPLIRSFWLSKKVKRRRALRPKIVREKSKTPQIEFEIYTPENDTDVSFATVQRANATCLCCGTTLPAERVRVQLSIQNGGADVIFDSQGIRIGGAFLLAVVTTNQNSVNDPGRDYRLANHNDYDVINRLQKYLLVMIDQPEKSEISLIPSEPLPWKHGHRAVGSPRVYGMKNWGDLFSARQKLSMIILNKIIRTQTKPDTILRTLCGLALSRFTDISNAFCQWESSKTQVRHIFTRQALPMLWDFAEPSLLGEQAGDYQVTLETMTNVIDAYPQNMPSGQAELANACHSPLPDGSATIWFTDPPYYDAIAYADLSDFFLVWLKRVLPEHPTIKPFVNDDKSLSPKADELTVTTAIGESEPPKTKDFFENGIGEAFAEGSRVLKRSGIGCIVFAHKTTEGWESLLTGVIKGNWVITGSWPISTELSNRLNAKETASLATSVHLIIRPRSENAEIGDWTQVSRELPRKVGDWMQRLQTEGVRGADLVFACIGPALEIYSRYSKVVDAEDREIPLGGDPEASEPHLRGYLAYVWETVGRLALEQVLGTSDAQKDSTNALEEDARLTALFLWTQGAASPQVEKSKVTSPELEEDAESEEDEGDAPKKKSKGGFALPFDVVRRFAQPLGIHLPEWEHRIIETDKGVVTLLSVKDRALQLFGEEGASAFASDIEDDPGKPLQMSLFAEAESAPKVRGRRKSGKEGEVSFKEKREATTLDRLHAAMLLQKGGQTTALRALLQAESERGSDFMRLANALTALYPRESEEKRLLDALLVNVRR